MVFEFPEQNKKFETRRPAECAGHEKLKLKLDLEKKSHTTQAHWRGRADLIASRIPPGLLLACLPACPLACLLAQEGPKRPKRGPREAQEGPRRPKTAQESPKRGPREAQEGPRWPKICPREAEDRPKRGPRRPKRAQESPKIVVHHFPYG